MKVKGLNKNLKEVLVEEDLIHKIKNQNFIKNESCFLMSDNRWYRINSPSIEKCEVTGEYHFIRDLKKVVTDIVESKLVFGYTSFALDIVDIAFEEDIFSCINEETAIKLGYEPCIYGRYYFNPAYQETSNLTRRLIADNRINKNGRRNYRELDYNLNRGTYWFERIAHNTKRFTNAEVIPLDEIIMSELENLSFGLELETSTGYIPENELIKARVAPLRDGSIRNVEFTTLPINDAQELANLRRFYKSLRNRCEIDSLCSLHVHFGNVPVSRELAIALYLLNFRLQNELFDIVPPYKRELSYFNSKLSSPQDHCKPLRGLSINSSSIVNDDGTIDDSNLKKEFEKLFIFLTNGYKESNDFNLDNRRHPLGDSSKWNFTSRYYHFNLLNYIFKSSKTVEYRLHSATTSYSKSMYWLLLTACITKYAMKNLNKILLAEDKITLNDVIVEGISNVNLRNKLLNYIESRRVRFNQDLYNDMYGEIERDNFFNLDKGFQLIPEERMKRTTSITQKVKENSNEEVAILRTTSRLEFFDLETTEEQPEE